MLQDNEAAIVETELKDLGRRKEEVLFLEVSLLHNLPSLWH